MPRQSLTRREDGRYKVKFQGKQFYGKTQAEAIRKRDEYKRMLEAGLKAEELGVSVAAYGARWLQVYKSGVTAAVYNTHLRHLKRFCAMPSGSRTIGSMPIRDVRPIDIQAYYNLFAGMSASSIHSARNSIGSLFRHALADRVILYDPQPAASLPEGTQGTHRAITREERQLIHLTPHKLRLLALTMLYAGLRRGEALALNVDRDVDFIRKTITVREAVRFSGQHLPILVDPKTEAGLRTVPLLDVLAEELRGHHGLLFSMPDGSHATYTAFKRAWESWLTALSASRNGCHKRWYGRTREHLAIQAAGGTLPPWQDVSIRTHDLRHAYCSMLYDAGVDIKTAQKWMGHADIDMTLKIYTHLSADKELQATAALQRTASSLSGVQNGVQNHPTAV